MTTEILKALEQHAESLAQLRGENLNLQLRLDKRLDLQAGRISKIGERINMQETLQGQNVAGLETALESIATLRSVNASQSTRIDDLERAILEEAGNLAGLGEHVGTRLDTQAIVVAKRGEQIETINDRLAIHVTRLDASASMHESAELMRVMDHNRSDQLEARIASHAKRLDLADQLGERIGDVEFQLEGKVDDLDREHADRLLAVESELEDTTRTANSAEMDAQDAKSDFGALEGQVNKLESDLASLQHTVSYG